MRRFMVLVIWLPVLLIAGCGSMLANDQQPDFSVISSPERPAAQAATPTNPPVTTTITAVIFETVPNDNTDGPSVFEMQPTTILPTQPLVAPTAVVVEVDATTAADTPSITATTVVTVEEAVVPDVTPTFTPAPQVAAFEPRAGGEWDMEAGFQVWINPFGDQCSGSQVASGWQGFTSRGAYGSSCFFLNDYGPNVFSGQFSQLVTFDFVDSQAGLYRGVDTHTGHVYQVTARLRHVHTLPPMEYHFGVELDGGTNWEAETVRWTPWAEFAEDQWITHSQTFTATGAQTTIFIKGFHPTAAQGGATYIDAVEVIDLG